MVQYFFVFCLFFQFAVNADRFLNPVDISFMVADVKYSKERGVQICEIQHGTDSIFKGDAFSNEGVSLIVENFVDFFASYNKESWVFPHKIGDRRLKNRILEQDCWQGVSSVEQLQGNGQFRLNCEQPVLDPETIASYHGFLFAKSHVVDELDQLYPDSSVILIDKAMLPVWRDKYKVSQCLRGDPLLESCKPKWNLYERKYSKKLAEQIISDLGSTRFVIKPRDEFCGNGVIIVDGEDLDQTLKYILQKSQRLKEDPDRAYRGWYKVKGDTFLVEEFIPSDSVFVPHLGMKEYCPTIRIVFLTVYEQGRTDIHFLGGYNCLPEKALSEEGDLHEKYKASLETIHSSKIDLETYEAVIEELYEPLRLFYKNVLETDRKKMST